MTLERDNKTTLKRRRFIKTAAGLTLAPIAIGLWGCGSSDSNSTTSDTNGSTGSDDSTDNGSDTSTDGWASGGTASMVSDFPDDSLFESSSV